MISEPLGSSEIFYKISHQFGHLYIYIYTYFNYLDVDILLVTTVIVSYASMNVL